MFFFLFFFSSRRRHTRSLCDWSSDVCSSDLAAHPSRRCYWSSTRSVRDLRGGKLPLSMPRPVSKRIHREDGNRRGRDGQIGRASCRERGENSGGAEVMREEQAVGTATALIEH